mgnify:CR=1 FL=1
MEIERKYLISHIPFDIAGYPFHQSRAGISKPTAPVVRVRQEDDTYYLT